MTYGPDLIQRYSGCNRYIPGYGLDPDMLLVAVPCLLEGKPPAVYALLDTASPWSVLPASTAVELGCVISPDPYVPALRTARFGLIRGRWEQLWVRFPADEGSPLDVLATFYVSADWNGPLVIGWKGCLEGVRIGLDPGEDRFYFAPL